MVEYIKRLKVCIRWFQDLELSYSLEQEKLRNSLELTQQKCIEIGKEFFFSFVFENIHQVCILMDLVNIIIELLLKIKEEELNSIISEMRRNCTSMQEKLIKEEAERSVREIIKSTKIQALNSCSKEMIIIKILYDL